MSEKLVPKYESGGEQLKLHEASEKNLDRLKQEAEKSKEIGSKDIEQLRQHIETQAVSGKERPAGEAEVSSGPSYGVQKELKAHALQSTLRRVRTRLNAPERLLSKTIHKPVIDKTSEVLGKTIVRPVGTIWAGFFAFTGSTLYLLIAQKYGYEYNYLLFFILLGVGYLLGTILELALRVIRRKHKA